MMNISSELLGFLANSVMQKHTYNQAHTMQQMKFVFTVPITIANGIILCAGSFFAQSDLSIKEQLRIIYYFVADTSAASVATFLNHSPSTIKSIFDKC